MINNTSSEKLPPETSPIKLVWDGSQFINHSLAIVNREIEFELLKRPEIELSIIPFEKHHFTEEDIPGFAPIAKAFYKNLLFKEFTIKHRWPPDFSLPDAGKLIIMQPWEMGDMPQKWYTPFIETVDEIWVYSKANKEIYIKAGIPEEKVFVVPLGIRKELYEKDYEPYRLNTQARYKFLFNGGTIFRKGVDLLIEAYIQEFAKEEDVCLVIKDIGINNIYQETYQSLIEKEAGKRKNPEIIYLKEDLNDNSLMELYKACDCYVHPYRGEGFGLPIAEAMGHGLPVIVTGNGSALDFCKPEFTYFLDFEFKHFIEVNEKNEEIKNLHPFPEVKVGSLRYWMRYVFNNREEAKQKGRAAKDFILENFTWQNTANIIIEHLEEIRNRPVFRDNLKFYFDRYFNQGINYFNNNNFEKAFQYFFYANNLNENSPENNYYLGLASFKLNLFLKGIEYLRKSLQLGYNEKEVYKFIALCLENLGDKKTAEMFWEKYF